MLHFFFSTVFVFLGLAVAVSLLIASSILMVKKVKTMQAVLYLAISASYAGVLGRTLIQQSRGTVCSQPSAQTILLYIVLTILHIFFIKDALKCLKAPLD